MIDVDRFDVMVALQVWQRCFVRACDHPHGISLRTETLEQKDGALEYLARGRMMLVLGRHLDGQDSAIDRAAEIGVGMVRDDLEALLGELDEHQRTFEAVLIAHLQSIREQGPDAIAAELQRVPEMRDGHRTYLEGEIEQLGGVS